MASPQNDFGLKVVEQAKVDNWQWSEALGNIVKAKFQVIFGTKMIEDAFHIGRGLERQGGSGNCKVRGARFWMRLPAKQLVNKDNRYRGLQWRRSVAKRGRVVKKLKSLHFPFLRCLPASFRTIRGTKQATTWYSPAPLFATAQDFDLELVKDRSRYFSLASRALGFGLGARAMGPRGGRESSVQCSGPGALGPGSWARHGAPTGPQAPPELRTTRLASLQDLGRRARGMRAGP